MPAADSKMSAAEIGNAHHAFLERVSLQETSRPAALKREAERLLREGVLSAEQIALLDFKALSAFWASELGWRIRAQAQFVHRELAFTARFAPDELSSVAGRPAEPGFSDQFVVVQGVTDLAVILPHQLWLVDFKTDEIAPKDLLPKTKFYELQLQLYARALARIYRRPVEECWLYYLARREAVAVTPGPWGLSAHPKEL